MQERWAEADADRETCACVAFPKKYTCVWDFKILFFFYGTMALQCRHSDSGYMACSLIGAIGSWGKKPFQKAK